MVYDLIICIFGCYSIPKYRAQIEKIQETWCRNDTHVKTLFFVSKQYCPDDNESFIGLDVNDSYSSASLKQYYGLKYIHEHFKYKYVHVCGTDTYIVIDRLLLFLKKLDSSEKLYIGGHGCHRIMGELNLYFHSGGPGFILSKPSMDSIHHIITTAHIQWSEFCFKTNRTDLIDACDVSIAYILNSYSDIKIVINNDFYHCNHHGIPCHIGMVNVAHIIACHNMSLTDMDDMHKQICTI